MADSNETSQSDTFEIERYRGMPKRPEGHVSFAGALEQHPHDREKIILVTDPFSAHLTCFEFNRSDIGGVEELPSLATDDGETVPIFRIWVKKGSLGIQCLPFIVDDVAGKWRR